MRRKLLAAGASAAVLLWGGAASAAITVTSLGTAVVAAAGTGTTRTFTPSVNIQAGDLVACWVTNELGNIALTGATDGTNTYTVEAKTGSADANAAGQWVWRANAGALASGTPITFTYASNVQYTGLQCFRVSGIATAAPRDVLVSAVNSSGVTLTPSIASQTLAQADEAVLIGGNVVCNTTYTESTNFQNQTNATASCLQFTASCYNATACTDTLSTTGPIFAPVLGATSAYVFTEISFKAAAGGAAAKPAATMPLLGVDLPLRTQHDRHWNNPYLIETGWAHGSAASSPPPPPPPGCAFTTSLADGCAGANANAQIINSHLADTGAVLSIATQAGTGGTPGTYSWTTTGGGGSGATGTIVVGLTGTAAVTAGGTSGYSAGDLVSFSNGAVLSVDTVSAGVITAWNTIPVVQPTANTAGALNQVATSGAGVGTPQATFTYSNGYLIASPVVSTPGSGYTSRPTIVVGGSPGVTGGAVVAQVYQTTPHNTATTFSLPGIDYGVSWDTTLSYKDPTVGGNLPGCATVAGSAPALVTVNSAPCTINGFDFASHNAYLTVAANLGASNLVTITNNKFKAIVGNGSNVVFAGSGACDDLIENNEFDGSATIGATGFVDSTLMGYGCTTGTLTVEYNYSHNPAFKFMAPAGSFTVVHSATITEKYNLFRNIDLSPAPTRHGENEYQFAGSVNQTFVMDNEFNVYDDEWAVHAQPIDQSNSSTPNGQAAMDAAGVADTVSLVSTVAHNFFAGPGPGNVTGGANSTLTQITGEGDTWFGAGSPGTITSGSVTDNYYDYSGKLAPFNGSHLTITGYSGTLLGGINMSTGNACTIAISGNTVSCN